MSLLGHRDLGRSRWPFLAIGGIVLAVFAAMIPDPLFIGIGVAASLLGAIMTYVRYVR